MLKNLLKIRFWHELKHKKYICLLLENKMEKNLGECQDCFIINPMEIYSSFYFIVALDGKKGELKPLRHGHNKKS